MNAVTRMVHELTHREKVAVIVTELKKYEQTDCPVRHYFAPNVYIREIFMPAGTIVIGKIHRTEHFNIIEKGRCAIRHDDGTVEILQAPLTFVSKAGVQKVLYIEEDTVWKTVHCTTETDVDKLEELLIEPPPVGMLEQQEYLTWLG